MTNANHLVWAPSQKKGNRLVVRLPAGMEMSEGEVSVRDEGDRLISEWPRKTIVELLAGMEALTDGDGFPDVDEGLLLLRDVDV